MIYLALYSLITAALLVVWHRIITRNKKLRGHDDEVEIDILRRARMMFPGESDVEALDALYQHLFRECLLAQKRGSPLWGKIREQSLAAFNAKNRAIIESLRFEERCASLFNTITSSPDPQGEARAK